MTLANRDRVLETSVTVGTGAYTLAGAVLGFQSFAAVGDGNTCHYSAWEVDANGNPSGGWECGLGTYTAAGTLLSRSSIYASSNAGAAVNWAAGTRRLTVGPQTNGIQVIREPGGVPGSDEVQISSSSPFGKIQYMKNVAGSGWIIQSSQGGGVDVRFNDGNGTCFVRYESAKVATKNGSFCVSNGDPVSTAPDVGLYRATAGVWGLGGNGSSGRSTFASAPLSPAAIAANQNDYNPGAARRYRLATDGSGGKSITGLSVSQVDGQECSIVNVSAADAITLTHQDAASTAANRFICTGAANIVLAVNEEALLWYDNTTARWRVRKI